MKKRKFSDVVLVFDSYYRKQSGSTALILKKILLCSGVTLCAMMFIIHVYGLFVNKILAGICCVLFASMFSITFVFVRKRFAVPTILLFSGLVIWCVGEPFWRLFSYFTDRILLICDGRFFYAAFFLTNNAGYIDPKYVMYCNGELLGVILLIALFSLINAACLFNKPHPVLMILSWFLLWIPPIMGEKLHFNVWLIPAVALYFGIISFSVTYSQGLAIGSGMSSYCHAIRAEEKSFLSRAAKMPYMKRVKSRTVYYSKYYSAAVYIFAVFALLGTLSSILFRDSYGLDYTSFYEFLISIGSKSGASSPFESGALSEYFANTSSGKSKNSLLGLDSPGTSNQEILRVSNSGSLPAYLRGDIGIDFTGTSWTSPVSAEPDEWLNNPLLENYLPTECNASYHTGSFFDFVMEVVSVEYLCDTDVAFMPAYTLGLEHFSNGMFDIYGDFVARASRNYKTIDNLQFMAIIPGYINLDSGSGEDKAESVAYLEKYVRTPEFFEYLNRDNSPSQNEEMFEAYQKFVNNTYLDVPEELVEPLGRFIDEHGFGQWNTDYYNEASKYRAAVRVADFLRENYTYSLTADFDRENPVMSFLNDTKSGHCALYASAMTLILRMMGIPARYCTGFVAQPSNGVPQTLRSKNLHAWCEVYLGGFGWTTFDPTSAAAAAVVDGEPTSDSTDSDSMSSDSISDEASSSDVQSGEASSEIPESIVESDENPFDSHSGTGDSTTSENPGDQHQKLNIMPFVLGISGIVLIILLVGLVVYRLRLLKSRAEEALKRYSKSSDADFLLKKIHDVMRVCALTPKAGELPEEFYRRAEKSLGCAVYDRRELLITAAFGDSKMCSCRELAGLLKDICANAEKSLNIVGRVRLRRVIVRKI